MKKNCTLLLGLAMSALLQLALVQNSNAQGTDGSGVILRITINGVNYDLIQGNCGYETANWGGEITGEFCAPAAWGYDITPDSLGCDSIPAGQLAGKVGMIRRGSCEFGLKALNAEKAGAIAVLIVNGAAATDDCNVIPMGAGAVGAQVTVPVLMIGRATANQISAAFAAGQTVEVCYILPRSRDPYTGYHYATPVSQAASIDAMGMSVINRESTTITDWVIKADIHEPDGNVTSITSALPPIAPGVDTLVFFPPYTPPAITGEFEVVFTSNKYTEPRDTLYRKFVQTDYTFAMDPLAIVADGGAMRNDLFAPTLKYQIGSLMTSGDNGGLAKYATFGIANIDSVYDPTKPLGNQIAVIMYDADSDENGDLNLTGSWEDDLASDAVGLTTYQMTGDEEQTKLIDVPILDYNFPSDTGVTMKPNHPYYITVLYNGEENGSGRNCAFTNGLYQNYLAFRNEALEFIPSIPMLIGTTFSSWGDRTVITRLQMEGYTPSVNTNQPGLLNGTKYSVTPNPASDNMRLNLDLQEQNSHVRVSIMSGMGRTLRSQSLRDFKSGQINFDVRDIPSGTYLMWIQTVEGQAITKVSICH